ncbi:dipeptidase [Acidisphaera sp. S103]|uniref:dipeptidase n=1 Tax=Acidisphaera sp. S103 TaxID=1747223 RepID=UPI001C20899C|nr:membrane dipeptidase [Acidisphaera sp. S103]
MLIRWDELGSSGADVADGRIVTVSGYLVAVPGQKRAVRFLLTQEPGCCPGCAPRDPRGTIEIEAHAPVPLCVGAVRLSGVWHVRGAAEGHARYRLADARPVDPPGWAGITRRRALTAGPLMCLAAPVAPDGARAAMEATTTVDLHSHAGGIASMVRMRSGSAFGPVSVPMRKGGMAAVCLAVVSDSPTHRLIDGKIRPYRDPDPNELYAYGQLAFGRLHDMARTQGLAIVTDAEGLRAAAAGKPSVIIAAEGADFLEGQPDRVEEAYKRWSLRHLQLTHYRVNEFGDIQTEPPVHGGLTDTGAEVIRRCNRLGIVVDVAHGTFDLVKRAVAVTTKPLVLSHTSLATRPSRFSRLIVPEHGRLVAQTGGVIGVWPPVSVFPTMDALAAGMARMVDAVGVDHVGLGSDMLGLVGPSTFPDYDRLPALAEALLGAGFSAIDTGKILGGNYVRVFEACMA